MTTVSLPDPALTSEDEIRRFYSEMGVDLRIDDLSAVERENMINSLVGLATETVAGYTLHHYDTENLVNSQWVRRRATIIACYELSIRRGNPSQFGVQLERVLDDLTKMMKEYPNFIIPGVHVRAADIPAVSNYIIDDRYRFNKVRVIKDNSTKPYPGQPHYDAPFSGGFQY